jgi:hypothetical protein
LRRSILPRLQKKRKSKDGKGSVKKQNKKKKKIVPKCTVTRKLFKEVYDNIECNSVCHIYKRKIKRGCELHCADSQNLYHELCIPKYHKKHIPISKDGDTFLCYSCCKE